MKNKKIIIILLIVVIAIIGITLLLLKITGNKKEGNKELLNIATTTVEERIMWNDFLKRNPYISKISIRQNMFIEDTTFINLAISSEDVELEYIVTEEIEQNPNLSTGEGYKKSRQGINEYLKNTFKKENIAYNFVETYCKDGKYLIIGDEYVYYTKLDLPKKCYILVNLEQVDGIYTAEIYEYAYNKETKDKTEEMLQTGKINKDLEVLNTYTITATIENNNICILSKT